jgi:cobalamin biosynthesis protein CobD/CbiB
LGGTNRYRHGSEVRPPLGGGAAPGTDDIARAVSIARRVGVLATVVATIGARR